MSTDLLKKKCVACGGDVQPLAGEELKTLSTQIPDWDVIEGHHLKREFSFPDFKSALGFVNAIGEVAEAENHHPNISFTWGKVSVEIWTHSIDGISENDLILAAKFDTIL